MTPLEKLQARWLKKTGEQMPDSIARLPIGRVLIAIELTEAGEHVFVPGVPVTSNRANDISLMEWDCASNY
jgi:hypothetical protein